MKRIISILLAAAAFLMVTRGFMGILEDWASQTWWGQEKSVSFTMPESQPSEPEPTETAETEMTEETVITEPTLPPETLPPETVPEVTEETVPAVPYRYGDLQLSQEEKELIAKLICLEGEGEPPDAQQAMAEVILNRIVADNFPSTAKGVVYAEGQFLSAGRLYQAQPTEEHYGAVERALNGPYIVDGDVVFFSQYAVNDNIWGVLGKYTFCRQW